LGGLLLGFFVGYIGKEFINRFIAFDNNNIPSDSIDKNLNETDINL
jgi:hypothetical protein